MPLTAIALNCSLKKSSGEASSTDAMIAVLKEHLAEQDVELAETIRIADYADTSGVTYGRGAGKFCRKSRHAFTSTYFEKGEDGRFCIQRWSPRRFESALVHR